MVSLDELADRQRAVQARRETAVQHVAPVLVREDEAGTRQADLGENAIILGYGGDLEVKAAALFFKAPWALVITEILIEVLTAPAGASIILDLNRNGTTMYTTQANRPTIPAGATEPASAVTLPDVRYLAKGDMWTMDIDQVGSTTAGVDLAITIRWRRA